MPIRTSFQTLVVGAQVYRALSFKEIGRDVVAKLEDPFTVEEVFTALSDLNGDKAPNLDGFSIAFWQFSWDFVKKEIMGFFQSIS